MDPLSEEGHLPPEQLENYPFEPQSDPDYRDEGEM
jgi:hypothetical protein